MTCLSYISAFQFVGVIIFVVAADEEDILLSQDMQDTLRACEMDANEASANSEEEGA